MEIGAILLLLCLTLDFSAPFDLEEFRRLADGMSDVPLGDVMSYVIKQQVNPKNLTPVI